MNENRTTVPYEVAAAIAEAKPFAGIERDDAGKMYLKYDEIEIKKSTTRKGMLEVGLLFGGQPVAAIFVEDGITDGRIVVLHGMQGRMGIELIKG